MNTINNSNNKTETPKKTFDLILSISRIAVGLFIFYSLFSIFYDKFEHLPAFLSDRFCLVWGIEKISIIVFSVFCFLIFKNINLGFNAIINWIASSTFGIYLLHMNNWTTFYIWDVLCKTKKYYMSKFMILHVIIHMK